MKRLSLKTTAAVACLAGATVSLALTGVTSATAVPVAPTASGSQTYATFIVPNPHSDDSSSHSLEAWATFGDWPGVSEGDFTATLGCDNALSYPVLKSVTSSGRSKAGFVTLQADLPLSLVGHSCTLTATTSNSKPIWFQPAKLGEHKGKTNTVIEGAVITRSGTGGL